MYCADELSCLPLPVTIPEPPQSGNIIHLMANVIHDEAPVTAKQIACATNSNPDLSQMKRCMMSSDWASLPEGVKPYPIQKDRLSIDADCLLWSSRVTIPPKLHGKIISELHNVHPGKVTMKVIARAHVWWPGLDSDIESSARHCYTCQAHAKTPPQSPLAMWS